MPLPAPDFERLFAPGTRHTLPGGDVATVRLRRDASLWLPSGRVVAGEPFMFDAMDESGFVQRVPPGHYPLELVLAVVGEPDDPKAYDMIAAARLVIREEPVVSWEMAVYEGRDVSTLGDDEFFGYPVDGGTGGFVDAASIAALCEDGDAYLDRVMACLEVRNTDPTAPGTLTDGEGRPLLVVFSSGDGDGHYPTWVGRTADGEVACFLTDFFILTDDEDDETGEDDETPSDDGAGYGNIVQYDSEGRETSRCVFLPGGDRLLFDRQQGSVVWSIGTAGHPGSVLTVRDDGIELRAPDGTVAWSVRTAPGTPAMPPRRADTTAALSPVKTSPARPLSQGRPLSPMRQSVASAAIPARTAVKASPKSAAIPADESGHVDPSGDVRPGKG